MHCFVKAHLFLISTLELIQSTLSVINILYDNAFSVKSTMFVLSKVFGKDGCIITATTACDRWLSLDVSKYTCGQDVGICPKRAIKEMTTKAEAYTRI